jgi:membrane protein DedA with SNARE-associated domain
VEAVFDWVSNYGYPALFGLLIFGIIGVPIPDETLLVFCGYLIAKGRLDAAPTLAAATLGSWCGISVSYWIGRTAGIGAVHRFGRWIRLDDRVLQRVHDWFGRSGHWALFIGYYIAGVRHFTAIVAGASKLEIRTFVIYAWTGALCWAAAFLSLGYFIGEEWRQIAELVHRYLTYFAVALVAAAVLFFSIRRRRSKNSEAKR